MAPRRGRSVLLTTSRRSLPPALRGRRVTIRFTMSVRTRLIPWPNSPGWSPRPWARNLTLKCSKPATKLSTPIPRTKKSTNISAILLKMFRWRRASTAWPSGRKKLARGRGRRLRALKSGRICRRPGPRWKKPVADNESLHGTDTFQRQFHFTQYIRTELIIFIARLADEFRAVLQFNGQRSEEHTSELQSLRHLV